jgi:putative phosphoribosyl transferase
MTMGAPGAKIWERVVHVTAGPVRVQGDLAVPDAATGIVVFAHGSGSSRLSPRNRAVARELQDRGLATLLIDLLTEEEEAIDVESARLQFDIGLLAERLEGATDWITLQHAMRNLPIGYFGASTGAAAALVAAASRPGVVRAVVSRGGRPDLAAAALPRVQAPTLLIVGARDLPVIRMNEEALPQLACEKQLTLVPGATHLFEEPGTLEAVARLAGDWFLLHLANTRA